MSFIPLFVFIVASSLVSCSNGESPVVIGLRGDVESLKVKIAEQQSSLTMMQASLFRLSLSAPKKQAEFDPQEDKAYAAVNAPAGPVLFILEKVEPYLDGYVVSMRLGNPTAAGYSGVKGRVRWGRLFNASKDEAYNQLAEKQIDIKEVFPSGTWTVVKFNIAPAKPEEVRRIIVEPTFDEVQLRRPFAP